MYPKMGRGLRFDKQSWPVPNIIYGKITLFILLLGQKIVLDILNCWPISRLLMQTLTDVMFGLGFGLGRLFSNTPNWRAISITLGNYTTLTTLAICLVLGLVLGTEGFGMGLKRTVLRWSEMMWYFIPGSVRSLGTDPNRHPAFGIYATLTHTKSLYIWWPQDNWS